MTAVLSFSGSSFWKRWIPLFALGSVGVVSVVPVVAPMITEQLQKLPSAPALPTPAIIALSMIQPIVLLGISVASGVALAPRLGFRSHIAEQVTTKTPALPAVRSQAPLAVAAGVATGLTIAGLDQLIRPWMPEALTSVGQAPFQLKALLAGMLYGGITEELLMRWGLMTLLAWLGWKVFQRKELPVHPMVVWAAIGASALLFGIGHLPAVSAVAPLTTAVIGRTIVLNGVGGIVFGWLYWRRSLEAAMIAHAMGHVTFAAIALIGSALR